MELLSLMAHRWWLSGCLLLVLSGCESMRSVKTQHEVQMQVDTNELEIQGYHFSLPPPIWAARPFADPGYEDEYVRLHVSVNLWGLNFYFESKQPTYTVLRLDQAKFGTDRSTLHPLRIYRLSLEGKRLPLIDVRGTGTSVQPIPVLLNRPKQRVGLIPDYHLLFDTSFSFGTWPEEQGHGLIDSGVGRSMVLELPIEYDGQRVTYQFTFTATDVEQWDSR